MGKHHGKPRKRLVPAVSGSDTVATQRRQALALLVSGAFADAEKGYLEVLRGNPKDFDAIHMLGVIALKTGRSSRGLTFIERALRVNANQPQANANLGNALMAVNRPDEAIRAFDRALRLDPYFVGALGNRSAALQALGRHDEAAESFCALLELAPDFDFALGDAFHARRSGADWRDHEAHRERLIEGISAGKRVVRPLPFLAVSSDARLQRECARLYGAARGPDAAPPLWRGERYGHSRIRVAYVSADFRGHAVLNLVASLFEHHSRERFDTLGIALRPGDGSEMLRAARQALGDFVDATTLSDLEVAQVLREREVDIAIDLTGYTQGGRPGVFARRAAPVQVNFLGYPGTLGAPQIDYVIADGFVIPQASGSFYDERIARLPDAFQPNSLRRLEGVALPECSRRGAGLPEAAVVLCSFNNGYKLSPEFLSIWARVLHQVPQAVLWLLAESPAAQQRLRAEAASRGLDAARLIFAPRVSYPEHLSRLRLADLYLDTLPFNAGATASDALWMGLPLLTCAGEAFSGRMAGSLLRAAGVPELITNDVATYETRALELARDSAARSALHTKLISARRTSALYDSARFCRHLEAAYAEMWSRAERGDAAADFEVTAIESLPCV